jgi:hypothetical protein
VKKATVPHCKRPCAECPFRKDTEPGQFPAERYEVLRKTAGGPGREAPIGSPLFACHKSDEGKEAACAGWLVVVGYFHLGVRLALVRGALPGSAMKLGADWPELYGSYEEMAEAQGG